MVPGLGLVFTPCRPLPSLACLPPVTLIGWSPFLRKNLPAPVWVESLESPKFAKSTWFVLKLLLCPQGEQGEDGKAEGPPGPPGDPVSAPSTSIRWTKAKVDPDLLLCGEGEGEAEPG